MTDTISKELCELIDGFIGENIKITGLSINSKDVNHGDIFIALPSLSGKNIQDFIEEAYSNDAAAIICEPHYKSKFDSLPINIIASDNPRKDLSAIAAKFYNAKPQNIVAVTGTNGKSSVCEFLRLLWVNSNFKACSIGTIGVIDENGDVLFNSQHTSPDTIELHKLLHKLHIEGYTHVAIEASSHGLDQYKFHDIPLSAAAFTNLTQDHLDYHQTMDHYFEAKSVLFSDVLSAHKPAIINADSEYADKLSDISSHRTQTLLQFGYEGGEAKILSVLPGENCLDVKINFFGSDHTLTIPLIGEFQVKNILCAALLAHSTGVSAQVLLDAIPSLNGVPGRLEYVGTAPSGASIYVDFAHTPDALENLLKSLRPHTSGNLWVVFGCGGDRDKLKRPRMGEIASRYADKVVVTNDNPRYENPETIRQEIIAKALQAIDFDDRKEAISYALHNLKADDCLVVAGKGHENTQIIGDTVIDFSDQDIIKSILDETKNNS